MELVLTIVQHAGTWIERNYDVTNCDALAAQGMTSLMVPPFISNYQISAISILPLRHDQGQPSEDGTGANDFSSMKPLSSERARETGSRHPNMDLES